MTAIKAKYENIPFHVWKAGSMGMGPKSGIERTKSYDRAMKLVGSFLEQGCAVHLVHRIVRPKFEAEMPYDVIDFTATRDSE